MNVEEQTERRLEREAREVRLGFLRHRDIDPWSGDIACVRVEVTYQDFDEDPEHCGYFLVTVPSYDVDGLDEDEAMRKHPTSLASERVYEWKGDREFAYFSIDDMSAA